MSKLVEGNPRTSITASLLGDDGYEIGTVETDYETLDALGNRGTGSVAIVGADDREFLVPSSVAFAVWAGINGGKPGGRVTTDTGVWHAYDWKLID